MRLIQSYFRGSFDRPVYTSEQESIIDSLMESYDFRDSYARDEALDSLLDSGISLPHATLLVAEAFARTGAKCSEILSPGILDTCTAIGSSKRESYLLQSILSLSKKLPAAQLQPLFSGYFKVSSKQFLAIYSSYDPLDLPSYNGFKFYRQVIESLPSGDAQSILDVLRSYMRGYITDFQCDLQLKSANLKQSDIDKLKKEFKDFAAKQSDGSTDLPAIPDGFLTTNPPVMSAAQKTKYVPMRIADVYSDVDRISDNAYSDFISLPYIRSKRAAYDSAIDNNFMIPKSPDQSSFLKSLFKVADLPGSFNQPTSAGGSDALVSILKQIGTLDPAVKSQLESLLGNVFKGTASISDAYTLLQHIPAFASISTANPNPSAITQFNSIISTLNTAVTRYQSMYQQAFQNLIHGLNAWRHQVDADFAERGASLPQAGAALAGNALAGAANTAGNMMAKAGSGDFNFIFEPFKAALGGGFNALNKALHEPPRPRKVGSSITPESVADLLISDSISPSHAISLLSSLGWSPAKCSNFVNVQVPKMLFSKSLFTDTTMPSTDGKVAEIRETYFANLKTTKDAFKTARDALSEYYVSASGCSKEAADRRAEIEIQHWSPVKGMPPEKKSPTKTVKPNIPQMDPSQMGSSPPMDPSAMAQPPSSSARAAGASPAPAAFPSASPASPQMPSSLSAPARSPR